MGRPAQALLSRTGRGGTHAAPRASRIVAAPGRCVIRWGFALAAPLAISLRGVVKTYGAITAVDRLDLDLPEGTCVGLLGPNGAGKSTTMKMLTAQAIADEGEISVLGYTLPAESKLARAECGVVPQLDNLDTTLTVEQNLVVFAYLYRLGRRERKQAVERALQIANLADRRDTRVDKLSGGMRRRLLIARGLVHKPRLVLLDEPTVGPRPAGAPGAVGADRPAALGGDVDPDVHPLHRGGRAAGRLRDDHVARPGRGRGPPRDLIVEHAGAEAVEVYGPPSRLAAVEAEAHAAGLATRRTGTSVALLRLNGEAPEGERRPANLEDVFVLLTGEEIS